MRLRPCRATIRRAARIRDPSLRRTEWLFDSIVTDPSNKITAAQTDATTGAVTDAEVPEDGLKIYYRYKKNIGKVKFDGNGGTPSPITLSGSGSTTGTTPVVSRYGYKITKWTLDRIRAMC